MHGWQKSTNYGHSQFLSSPNLKENSFPFFCGDMIQKYPYFSTDQASAVPTSCCLVTFPVLQRTRSGRQPVPRMLSTLQLDVMWNQQQTERLTLWVRSAVKYCLNLINRWKYQQKTVAFCTIMAENWVHY